MDKKYYLFKDGECYFSDFILSVDGLDFQNKNLMKIHLGSKTTRICEEAFVGNYLTSVTFYKKIKHIESRAFANNKLEKIIFSRSEVPTIAKDAFVGNPIRLVVVPHVSAKAYRECLSHVEFDREFEIKTNMEVKFEEMQSLKTENDVLVLWAYSIYGTYSWRIERVEWADLDNKFREDKNEGDFGEIEIHHVVYHVYKDSRSNIAIYRKENGRYIDLTLQDFEAIYEDSEKAIL